ncbi:hypothetical protein [Clostridium ljungdahlii]|uniref:hypothetical protein n=1 Tax=Clostridium ljungdahlii TaxID=1538 RepID=UPI00386D7DCB
MLTNNTEALILAEKIGKEAALSCLQGMYDYGTSPMKVLDMIKEKPNCKVIVGALNNSDTDGMLNILAKTNPAGLAAGLSVLAKASGAEEALLELRNTDNEAELLASAKTAGVKLRVEVGELVDVRAHKEHIIFNLETLAGIADKITGTAPGIIIAVDEDVPKEVKFGTKLVDFLDTAKVKSVMINHHFYRLDVLNNGIIKENSYGSGVIHIIYENDCIVEKTKKN